METRRLELLVALARLGSMRAVGEELGITTSTVSQQLAALAHRAEPGQRHQQLQPTRLHSVILHIASGKVTWT